MRHLWNGSLFMRLWPVIALLAGAMAVAGERIPGPIPARVLSVIDGDTLLVRARIWLGQEVETRVRMAGVDAPELAGRCGIERDKARQARAFAIAAIGGGPVVLREIQYGKYAGRVVARVLTADGADLARLLIQRELGHAYQGGKRQGWC